MPPSARFVCVQKDPSLMLGSFYAARTGAIRRLQARSGNFEMFAAIRASSRASGFGVLF
jgi:hypothetical protein